MPILSTIFEVNTPTTMQHPRSLVVHPREFQNKSHMTWHIEIAFQWNLQHIFNCLVASYLNSKHHIICQLGNPPMRKDIGCKHPHLREYICSSNCKAVILRMPPWRRFFHLPHNQVHGRWQDPTFLEMFLEDHAHKLCLPQFHQWIQSDGILKGINCIGFHCPFQLVAFVIQGVEVQYMRWIHNIYSSLIVVMVLECCKVTFKKLLSMGLHPTLGVHHPQCIH